MLTEVEIIKRLVLASFIGYMIGFDREKYKKPAGGRTHALICLASAMTVILGTKVSEQYPNIDPLRVSAQIVSGLSFIGVGTILKGKHGGVIGLTTATTLLTICVVGLACGAGYYSTAIIAALLIEVILHVGAITHKRHKSPDDAGKEEEDEDIL